jgi:hypothetical protein
MKTISNLNESLTSSWKFLRGLYSMARSFFSFTSQPSRSVHVLDTSLDMHEVRVAMAILLRTREEDDSATIAVKNVLTKLWLSSDALHLLDLSADGVVMYYNDKVLAMYDSNTLMGAELRELETLAVFLRAVRAIKNIYCDNGWLDAPTKFMA